MSQGATVSTRGVNQRPCPDYRLPTTRIVHSVSYQSNDDIPSTYHLELRKKITSAIKPKAALHPVSVPYAAVRTSFCGCVTMLLTWYRKCEYIE
jgi:hypothetical protein